MPRAGWRWTCSSPSLAADPAFKRRFIREARKAAKLDHPNIVPLYAVGELDGQLYTAARFVDGDDLRDARPPRGSAAARAGAVHPAAGGPRARRGPGRAASRTGALDDEAILVERHSDHVYVCDFGLGAPAARRRCRRSARCSRRC